MATTRVDSFLIIDGLGDTLNLTRAVPLQGRLKKCGGTSKGGSPVPVDRVRQIHELARCGLPEYAQYSGFSMPREMTLGVCSTDIHSGGFDAHARTAAGASSWSSSRT